MNSRSGNLDLDAIVEQLAHLDSSDPADPTRSPEPSSTVRELKAHLDTMIDELRAPAGPDAFADETGLRRAQELVRAIGVNPGSNTRDQRLELGRIGPYELLEKLGEGGMGAVYKALHSSLEKIVALKVLPRERLHAQAISRFKREMKAVGKLDHPNIVRATDAGEADGDHFLVMEYVDGVDLSELLRRVGPLAIADACELTRQAAIGLQHAHQRRMVHRDIKPNNIMLAWSDEHEPAVKILDMGLALLSEPMAAPHGDLTTTGQMMGTVEYMSPEQGMDTHNVDIRSDIYSLGATLYKLLSGKAPFTGERYNTPGKILVALATEKPESIAVKRDDLPAGLIAIVDRMLAKDPAERFATPAEVAQALTPFATGADLRRLSDAARGNGAPANAVTDKSEMPTAEHLSSPITGTVSEVKRECEALREVEAPAEPEPATKYGSAGASPSQNAPSQSSSLFRFSPKQQVAIALGGLLLMLAAVIVYRIQTDYGTLVVRIEDPAVQALLQQDGLVIHDKNSVRTWTIKAAESNPLPSGEYRVQGNKSLKLLVTDDSGAELTTEAFTLKRGQEVRVHVTLEQAARVAATNAMNTTTSDPDRRVAEWVLSMGGEVLVEGGQHWITIPDKLPEHRFKVDGINFSRPPSGRAKVVGDADLENLSSVTSLRTLHFSGWSAQELPITDAGLVKLSTFPGLQNLQMIRLYCTQVSNAGFTHFQKFPQLSFIVVGGFDCTESGLKHLEGLPNLQRLTITQSQISDVELDVISRLKLVELGLASCEGFSMPRLAKLGSSVRELNLNDTDIRDEHIAAILGIPNLYELQLRHTKLTDKGAMQLASITNLIDLDLSTTKVTADCVKKLHAALPQCTITSDHGKFGPMQSTNPDRRAAEWVLSIGGKIGISEHGQERPIDDVRDLPRGAFELTGAHLNENPQVSGEGLAFFKDCTNLTSLSLGGAGLTDHGLAHFKNCTNLTHLSLDGPGLTRAGLATFQDLKTLTHLTLGGPGLTDAGLAHFKNCKDLTHLSLTGPGVTDAGLTYFQDCKSLERLDLNAASVSDAGLERFSGCTKLGYVAVKNTMVSEEGVKRLSAALPGCKIERE